MFNLQKQLRTLYVNSALNAFQIAGASWVALLAARGYSLVEIGMAESVFHFTSLLGEVPSGVASDMWGRKKAMVCSQCLLVLAALAMLVSRGMPGILLAMALDALSYNFSSGTREALAYDSLKQEGREGDYDRFSSTELMIYRLSGAAATLCAGLALAIGYRKAYLIDALLGASCLAVTLRLKETGGGGTAGARPDWARIKACFRKSFDFLRGEKGAVRLIFLNAGVGAFATLLGFFLQARLPACGLPDAALGPALFVMGLGGAVGARAVLLFRKWRYGQVYLLAAAGVAGCLGLSFVRAPVLMIACGFGAALFDDLIEVRSDIRLNQLVPSGQRATLLSVSSLCFSLVMIGLSPLLGKLFSM